ncbi:MAG: hypothetical protein WCO14_03020 [bacterium]
MRRSKGGHWVKAATMLVCCLALIWLGPAGIVGQEQESEPVQDITPPSRSTSAVSSLGAAGELSAGGQWTPLPLFGAIMALVIDPSNPLVLYASIEENGVYKSTNGGANWVSSSIGLSDSEVRSLAIVSSNPQTLYASANDGVFKSINGGANWVSFSSGMTNTNVWCLAINPSNPQILYAGTHGAGGGVFKSSNGGTNWVLSSNGLTYSFVRSLAINPSNPQILYAGTYGGGIFKSSNGAANWGEVSSGLTNKYWLSLAIDPSNPQTLYAGSYGDAAWKSTNGGMDWTSSSIGLLNGFVGSLAIDPSNSQTIYAGTDDGIFKSGNSGDNWADFSSGLLSRNLYALAIDPSNSQIIYAGASGGAFKYTPPSIILLYNLSAGWNMISVPLVLPNPSSKGIIPEGWPIYSWDASNARYSSLPTVPLTVGAGYWLKAPFAQNLMITGPPYTGNTMAIPLAYGWNMIGTPYNQPVSYNSKVMVKYGNALKTLDQAVASGWIKGPLYRWTGSAYDVLTSGGVFQPLAGYWVKVLLATGCSMIFTKP